MICKKHQPRWIGLVLAAFLTLAIAHPSLAHAKPGTGLRLTYEALGGVGGIAVPVGAAALVVVTSPDTGGGRYGSALVGSMLTLYLPIVLSPLGVYLAGNACGAHGSYWLALGGDVVGGLLSLVPGALFMNKEQYVLTVATLWVMEIAGAVAGYEIWNYVKRPKGDRSPPAAGNARYPWLPFNVMWRF
jgi:hypothetical protein